MDNVELTGGFLGDEVIVQRSAPPSMGIVNFVIVGRSAMSVKGIDGSLMIHPLVQTHPRP